MIDAAIVGLGRWGQNHVNSVQGMSMKVRFTRGLVRNPAKSQEFAHKHGLRLSSDYTELLADPALRLVVRESPGESSGGSITATGIHVLDAFVNLVGPVHRLSAQHILQRPPPESLDTLAITFEFANRVSGVLCGVRATPLFWRVHVFGNRG